ncbi:Hypothetical protein D9617_14g077680 [Elsinoe fawcettii]|nr:Hypothetical protein D9617_14g077680 [Elsinoe fawcettii]
MAPLPFPLSPLAHLPHAPYEEDQRFSHTILTSHVLYRGFQTGAVLALPIAGAEWLYRRRFHPPSSVSPATATGTTAPSLPRGRKAQAFSSLLLRRTGPAAIIGTAFMVPGLLMRMKGREEIEWQSRSWRLLENKGQMEVDEWSLLGLGVAGALVAGRVVRPVGWRGVVGLLAVGNLVGVGGYMIARYGEGKGEGMRVS